MALEIERKFLVEGDFKGESYASEYVMQGYLSSVPQRSVRVRLKGDKGYLTIKGIGGTSGVVRYEWEKEIPVSEARDLMQLCEPGAICKQRYYVRVGKHVWEVDEFEGDNTGLIVAEIELSNEAEEFVCPTWLGKEVSGDDRYYNASLSKFPYCKWQL